MFKSIKMRARSAALIGVAAALVVGGVAAAQGSSTSGAGEGPKWQSAPPGPAPMMGAGMKGLTNGELHIQKNGHSEVIRLDQGKITAVDSSSLTLAENDGGEVTITLDENTKVLAGPESSSSTAELSVGESVLVSGPEGGAAASVMVAPKRGQMLKGTAPGGQMPPPPLGS